MKGKIEEKTALFSRKYIFYYKQKIFGGIYEPGFMVKITEASKKYLPEAERMPTVQGSQGLDSS